MPAATQDALVRSGLGYRAPAATTGLATYLTPGLTSPLTVTTMSYAVASTADLTARADIVAAGTTRYAAATARQAYLAAHPGQPTAVQVVTVPEVAP
jgi:hypothetical protein